MGFDFSTGLRPPRLAGLGRRLTAVASVEKDRGLKSKGDVDRNRPLIGSDGAGGVPLPSRLRELGFVGEVGGKGERGERGEEGGGRCVEPVVEESGEKLSGLAILRPPRDSDKFKSPSMLSVYLATGNAGQWPVGGTYRSITVTTGRVRSPSISAVNGSNLQLRLKASDAGVLLGAGLGEEREVARWPEKNKAPA